MLCAGFPSCVGVVIVLWLLLALVVSGASYLEEEVATDPQTVLSPRERCQLHKKGAFLFPGSCQEPSDSAGRAFAAANVITARTPVVLIPGLGGSALEAKLKKHKGPHWYCTSNADWFRLWFSSKELFVQDCWVSNMDMRFDEGSGTFQDAQGTTVRVMDFGGVKGIDYLDYIFGVPDTYSAYFASVIKSLEQVGYKVGQDLAGAPYDWRRPIDDKGNYDDHLRSLVEALYARNGQRPVALVAHSMGGPTALHFLGQQTQEWKEQYIEQLITLGSPWLGAFKSLRAILIGDEFGISLVREAKLKEAARHMGGLVWLLPQPVKDTAEVLVTTKSREYRIGDLEQLFRDAGTPVTSAIYRKHGRKLSSLDAPGVPFHCMYALGLDTETSARFANGLTGSPRLETASGDGTVPASSLQHCRNWDGKNGQTVTTEEFSKISHTEMLSDETVIRSLLARLVKTETRSATE